MSELQSLKKAELNEICHRLGIHALSKDTKKVLIDKVTEYIAKNGDAGVEAVQAALDAEIDDTETLTEQVEAAVAAAEAEEDEEEEGDDEDAEEKDADYQEGPPLDLKAYIVDPAIQFYEDSLAKVLELTDSVGITSVDINGELRENLSKSVTLNFLELVVEFGFYLYYFVPLVAIKNNESIHQIFKDNISFLAESDFEIPDISALFAYGPLATFSSWLIIAVIAPLIASYYINFTRRLITFEDDTEFFARIYTSDPFTFALSKLLFFYFLATSYHKDFSKSEGFFTFVFNHLILHQDYFQKFATVLGGFPIVIGLANVLVAIYSQFEEY
ncbi:hypothetical protein CLIB1423_06S01574 [[Candida] railenensis]|uniref:SAP domain-containing protein n=1 Tax=[Candida] railenensis TaxID=45579 RepID=A0A9P0VY73_9ASCO|nr:hypothetical protein CLIB1423_06S01574 [[Candida] railenensis]